MTMMEGAWSLRCLVRWLGRVSIVTAGLIGVLQGQAVARAHKSPAPAGPRGIATVTVLEVQPGEVDLALSAPVEVQRDYLRGGAQKADRCYIDLSPAAFTAQAHSVFDLPTGPIQKVRLSQFHQGVVRVVLDLRGSHECRVTVATEPRRLTIVVAGAQGVRPDMDRQTAVQSSPLTQDDEPSPAQERPGGEEVLSFVGWRLATHFELLFPFAYVGVPTARTTTPVPEHAQNEQAPAEQTLAAPPASEPKATDILGTPDSPSPVASQVAPVEQLSTKESLSVSMPAQEPNRIGGEIVHEFWQIMMGASLLLSFLAGASVVFLWNARKRGARPEKKESITKSDGWETRMAYLEEAVNRAGMLNSSFFHSLEVTQKRLEALLTQADVAEQNLRRLLHQTALTEGKAAGRTSDSYSTAASLLAEGEDVQQVARVLKIPVAQVRVLQELRQSLQEEKSAGTQEKSAEAQHGRSLVAGLKSFVTHLNGAQRNGTPLAHNG